MPRPRKQHHASFGSLTMLPSGRYRARCTGPDGLRRSAPVTFATKTAAEDWLARTRADMSHDQRTAPERGPVTLAEFSADWLDSLVDLRPTTVALYRQLSRRWLLTVHGGIDPRPAPVGAITPGSSAVGAPSLSPTPTPRRSSKQPRPRTRPRPPGTGPTRSGCRSLRPDDCPLP